MDRGDSPDSGHIADEHLLRYRKIEKLHIAKMVGSGGDESVNVNMTESITNLHSDSEAESGDEDTRQLITQIPSTMIKGLNNNSRKTANQNQAFDSDDENVWSISIQMFIPFLLAGFGMVAASLLLDVVQVNEDFSAF